MFLGFLNSKQERKLIPFPDLGFLSVVISIVFLSVVFSLRKKISSQSLKEFLLPYATQTTAEPPERTLMTFSGKKGHDALIQQNLHDFNGISHKPGL